MELKRINVGKIIIFTILTLSLLIPFLGVQAKKPLKVGPGKDYPTISEAVFNANPGDTIRVYPGTYSENIVVEKNGLKIIGVKGAEKTILDADGLIGKGFYVDANEVTIKGLTITGFNYGIYMISSERCVIQNNIIHGIRSPALGIEGTGIHIDAHSHDNKILKNRIYDCDNNGVFIGYTRSGGTCYRNVVQDNTIFNCAQGKYRGAGIWLRNADYTIIKRNEIYGVLWGKWPYGIVIRDSDDYNKIMKNYIHDNTRVIHIFRTSTYNNIQRNTFENNEYNYVNIGDPELSIGNIIKNNIYLE